MQTTDSEDLADAGGFFSVKTPRWSVGVRAGVAASSIALLVAFRMRARRHARAGAVSDTEPKTSKPESIASASREHESSLSFGVRLKRTGVVVLLASLILGIALNRVSIDFSGLHGIRGQVTAVESSPMPVVRSR